MGAQPPQIDELKFQSHVFSWRKTRAMWELNAINIPQRRARCRLTTDKIDSYSPVYVNKRFDHVIGLFLMSSSLCSCEMMTDQDFRRGCWKLVSFTSTFLPVIVHVMQSSSGQFFMSCAVPCLLQYKCVLVGRCFAERTHPRRNQYPDRRHLANRNFRILLPSSAQKTIDSAGPSTTVPHLQRLPVNFSQL